MTDKQYPNLPDGTVIGFEYNTFPWEKPLNKEFYLEDSVKACTELFNVKPESVRFHSCKDIYPIRDKTEMAKYSKIEKEANSYENFYLNGRFGNFKYTNMNDCFEMSFDLIQELSLMDKETLISEIGL